MLLKRDLQDPGKTRVDISRPFLPCRMSHTVDSLVQLTKLRFAVYAQGQVLQSESLPQACAMTWDLRQIFCRCNVLRSTLWRRITCCTWVCVPSPRLSLILTTCAENLYKFNPAPVPWTDLWLQILLVRLLVRYCLAKTSLVRFCTQGLDFWTNTSQNNSFTKPSHDQDSAQKTESRHSPNPKMKPGTSSSACL